MFKYFIKRMVYFLLHIFWFFPINNKRIYFESFAGKQISCNPLYIYEGLSNKYKRFEYIWCYNGDPPQSYIEKGIKFVRYRSIEWIVACMTSLVLVSNHEVSDFLPLRKRQIFIDTWHGGGAYKRVALQDKQEKKALFNRELYQKRRQHKYLFKIISSSNTFTECMTNSLLVNKNDFLEIGMPRNDIFFDKNKVIQEKKNVYKLFNLQSDCFFVLYAPTYRGHSNTIGFDVQERINLELLSQAIFVRFRKRTVIAIRMHYHVKCLYMDQNVLDVTEYPNMQELLCAADMLITDYSSSMWDYSFTGKPCILFAPDIEKYQKERGFYTDPYTWGFPIAKTNEELCKIIEEFDIEDFIKKMEMHHATLGSYENGNATERICNFIVERVKYIAD